MRGEREIRPKWPAIYTFLERDKWWQKWWQMGWVITFPMTDCELFTSRPWLRLQSRLEAVFAVGGNNVSDLLSNGKSPPALPSNGINASVAKPFCLACSMLLLPFCIHLASIMLPHCFLLCGWDCFHILLNSHHMLICNSEGVPVLSGQYCRSPHVPSPDALVPYSALLQASSKLDPRVVSIFVSITTIWQVNNCKSEISGCK